MKRSHRRSAEAAALYYYRRECIDHRNGRHCRTDFLPGTLVIQKIRTRGCGFFIISSDMWYPQERIP